MAYLRPFRDKGARPACSLVSPRVVMDLPPGGGCAWCVPPCSGGVSTMIYRVKLANRESGDISTLDISASTENEAYTKAMATGLLVGSIKLVRPGSTRIARPRNGLISTFIAVLAIAVSGSALALQIKTSRDMESSQAKLSRDQDDSRAMIRGLEARTRVPVQQPAISVRDYSSEIAALTSQTMDLTKRMNELGQTRLAADSAENKRLSQVRADIDLLEKKRGELLRDKAEKIKNRDTLLSQRNHADMQIRPALDHALDDFDTALKECDQKIKAVEDDIYKLRKTL